MPPSPEALIGINDLITLNLDIRQFAQDVIDGCEGPDLLRALWHAIEKVTILDPTCGSGAFLFAALNILEPLYEACLDRMEAMLNEETAKLDPEKRKATPNGVPLLPHGKYDDFSKVLEQVAAHPNRRYFIFKSIILNNLYGVDLMEEAVEICKLRLFLKLAAQVEPDAARPNGGIEPLPDVDFNIRAGNTLVGFANFEEVLRNAEGDWIRQQELEETKIKAADLQTAFNSFRDMQTQQTFDSKEFTSAKQQLRQRLKALEDELNRYLAADYGVKPGKKGDYEKWLKSHQPFHWFVDFYGIVQDRGGFDVIIGNPPYLETRQIEYELKGYSSLVTAAIHAMCIERSTSLLRRSGCMSMIVPISLPSTQRMKVIQELLELNHNVWYANYAWRPAKLFDTVNRALTIFVIAPGAASHEVHSTNYQKWTSDNREGLFERQQYMAVPSRRPAFWVPKVGDAVEPSMLAKCFSLKTAVVHFTGPSKHYVYYRCDGGLYWKVFTEIPPAFKLNGKAGHSSRETKFSVFKREHVRPIIAVLSSTTFWWWYTVTSNLRHLNPYDVQNFPLPGNVLSDTDLLRQSELYLNDIAANSTMLVREQRQTGRTETQSFKIQKSKAILDEIDRILARYYGFTEAELEFIINYDIKYRMSRDSGEDSD